MATIADLTESQLTQVVEDFSEARTHFKRKLLDLLASGLEEFFTTDFLVQGVSNTMLRLSRNLSRHLEEEDALACVATIRMMLDAIVTLYGVSLVAEPEEYVLRLMKGEELRTLTDSKGERLSYAYLCKELDKALEEYLADNSSFHRLYKSACAGIHFSSLHILRNVEVQGERTVHCWISDENMRPLTLAERAEILIAEDGLWTTFVSLLQAWHKWKEDRRAYLGQAA